MRLRILCVLMPVIDRDKSFSLHTIPIVHIAYIPAHRQRWVDDSIYGRFSFIFFVRAIKSAAKHTFEAYPFLDLFSAEL